MKHWLAIGLLLTSMAGYCQSQTAQLSEYTASYEANANGLAGAATRSLSRIDEDSYRLSNTLEASLAGQTLANLSEASEFIIEERRVIPQNYSYLLSGISQASHAVGYNWDAGVAISSEDDESWQLALHSGVLDQLSYQAALRLALQNRDEDTARLIFEIVDGDGIDRHEYRVVGTETIATELGELNTVKLERLREASDERITEFWLAIDWEFLLARMVQINGSGLHIELEIKAATLGGEEVSATR